MNEIDRHVELARMFTPLMRTSTEEQWPAVREFLKDRGVDPDRAEVGDVFPDQVLFIIVAAEDGRAFDLTTWFEPDDETNYVIESWQELAGDRRDIHSGALYGAFALLSEETEGVADPLDILAEMVERTHANCGATMTGCLSDRPCSRQDSILDERSWSTGFTPSRSMHHRNAAARSTSTRSGSPSLPAKTHP